MSGISSGIGLVSGINTAQLIDQLIELERGPIKALQKRVTGIDTQRTALAALSASLLALRQAAARFDDKNFFRGFKTISSNESILTAQATSDAAPGSYRFRVQSLVSNHAVVSRGFADADQTPVGSGTLTIEVGGRVDPDTKLAVLNGGSGVRRGTVVITDRAGNSAEIDLTRAVTVTDVLDAINNAAGINVRARVTGVDGNGASGERIVIEDQNEFAEGSTAGRLIVADKASGTTATDLGIAGSTTTARLDGLDLIHLDDATPLSFLNDGNGIGRTTQLQPGADLSFSTSDGDFDVNLNGILAQNLNTDLRALNNGNGVRLGVIRITDRAGKSVEIDLADPDQDPIRTVADLRNRINSATEAAGVSVRLGLVNSSFQITDNTGLTGENAKKLIVEDVSGNTTADLGISGNVSSSSIVGRDAYRIASIGDVLRAINYATGNDGIVEASISADGNGIVLTALDPAVSVQVNAGDSTAARDLGIEGLTFGGDQAGATASSRPLLGGLNSVLLNSLRGGRGITTGVITLTDAAGQSGDVDLTSARTLQDVIDLINTATEGSGLGLSASINAARNGIQLTDDSGGSGNVIVADQSGSLAADLGLAGTHSLGARRSINGGNAQFQYITENTLLSEFNNGAGVEIGSFNITDSAGGVHTVALSALTSDLGDVIKAINDAGGGVIEGRINDTGDGLVVVDQAGGDGRLTIEDEEGGRTARDLKLTGTASANENYIDGTLEIRVNVGGRDTLRDLVTRINNAGGAVAANIVNDGSGVRPYSLTLTSEVAGAAGELTVDSGDLAIDFSTLSRPRDAVVSVGGGDGASSILVTGTSNTIENAVPGLSLNLLSAGSDEVTVSVTEDIESVIEDIRTFVSRYNDLQSQIDTATAFNQESLERGPLQGDRTVNQVRNRLRSLLLRSYGDSSSISRLSAIGIRPAFGTGANAGSSNNRLEFDEERFRQVYAQSPDRVAELFSSPDTGFGAVIDGVMDELSNGTDGLITQHDGVLLDQQELLQNRIDQLNQLLAAKRSRLETQFAGLESALAALQDQQNSLNTLAQLAGQ
ncbi:MAG: flagellar filament capping protein FliD [Phycisphaerae bacterium]|nr:flagellar filament capping protein FliD [Phycisphaerae bacterium]